MLVAHIGHWIGYVLYAIAVLVLVLVTGVIHSSRVARRRGGNALSTSGGESDGPKL